MTTPPPSAKSQAEAMAAEIVGVNTIWSDLVHDMLSMVPHEKLKASISTALEKLIAENERLKKLNDEYRDLWDRASYNTSNLQSQLTATEARLSEAMAFIENLSKEKRWSVEHSEMRSTRHAILAVGFLSTLTAEKKEQG